MWGGPELFAAAVRELSDDVRAQVNDYVSVTSVEFVASSCESTPASELVGLVEPAQDGYHRIVHRGLNFYAEVSPGPAVRKALAKFFKGKSSGSARFYMDFHLHHQMGLAVRVHLQGSLSSLVETVAGGSASKAVSEFSIDGKVQGIIKLSREFKDAKDPSKGLRVTKRLGLQGEGTLDLKSSKGSSGAVSKLLSTFGDSSRSSAKVELELDLPLKDGSSLTPDTANMFLELLVKGSSTVDKSEFVCYVSAPCVCVLSVLWCVKARSRVDWRSTGTYGWWFVASAKMQTGETRTRTSVRS